MLAIGCGADDGVISLLVEEMAGRPEGGYVSIGDFHTTRRWEPGMREEDTRFNGLKRECGIHVEV